jgi:hypothetical protein
VQLATVRFLGTFLAHPADVPPIVAKTLAKELAVDPDQPANYARRGQTHREHAGEIQRVYGYRDFSDRSAQAELTIWLHARAWTTAERPSVLFDLATARLIEATVLLPGASVLARLIAAARDQASEHLYATLAGALTAGERKRLRALLEVIPGELLSDLERLRSGPRKLPRPSCWRRCCASRPSATSVSAGSSPMSRPAESVRWPATGCSRKRRRCGG